MTQRVPRLPRKVSKSEVGVATPIVGIDVETACSTRGAVCSIGVSVVQRGAVVRERHWYIDPGTRFDPRFIGIHGITPAQVAGAPRLSAAWSDIDSFLSAAIALLAEPTLFAALESAPAPLFVAHNAQFDRTQIESALGRALPFPIACTVAMSRRAFPKLERHNLAAVSAHLEIALRHHDALSDARACALIAHRCIAQAS
jgi:DNA polymerase III subunit epsilon